MRKKIFLTGLLLALAVNGNIYAKTVANSNTQAKHFKEIIKNIVNEKDVNVSTVNNTIILKGSVDNENLAYKLEEVARTVFGANKPVLNLLKVKHNHQIMLRVKFGEIKTSVLKDYAPNTLAQNLDWLESKGVFKMYAEPTLISLSGREAEFETGGEIPVYNNDKENTVTYKPYGIKLRFTPEILSNNRIRLDVMPEITEIVRGSNSSNILGLPSFASHYAKTTVDLAPGESFMIAGLLKNSQSLNNINKGLFAKANGIEDSNTELVIAVTPYLVAPNTAEQIKVPSEKFDLDKEFHKLFDRKLDRRPEHKNIKHFGDAGYIAE